ncbi:MAG TPA: DNA-binding response regulator, partial [Rikenellaceae bacterium]|nr:DNA-binding response regulator [Rikenellaceae bacterium]
PAEVTAQRKIKSIFVKTEYRLQQIDLDRITYIEGLKDYVKIHMSGSSAPIMSLMRMKSLEDKLPKDDFVRVHKSFIVRLAAIEAIERNHILIGPDRITIGDTYQPTLYQALSDKALMP